MEYEGSSVYDNSSFLTNYLARRNREDSPNNLMERPVFLELMGDVSGLIALDLGCGDARFGLELIEQGCKFYEGVEGSAQMVDEARKVVDPARSKIHHSSMESWTYPTAQYDLVVSRLALHYLQDLEPIFDKIRSSLVINGQFIFSVQHPVLTSSMKSAEASGKKSD